MGFVQVLEELIRGTDLTQTQTEGVMETLLADANPAIIGAFLALLRAKGETLDEVLIPLDTMLNHCLAGFEQIKGDMMFLFLFLMSPACMQVTGLASAMLKLAVPVRTVPGSLDIVGTGGDGANTVNISTGSCILAAACGAKVAKVNKATTFPR